jgi:hypothetical protein
MTRHVLIVCEGPHDEAFIAKILRARFGFREEKFRSKVDSFWIPTIPTAFPKDDDLRRRMPVPMFYATDSVSAAVFFAGGDSLLSTQTADTLAVLPGPLDAVGVVLDADTTKSPVERFEQVRNELTDSGLDMPKLPGEVGTSSPARGIYVLPDNLVQGTLESLLIECGRVAYPGAITAAESYVGSVQSMGIPTPELRDFQKASGRNKSMIHAVGAILRPGKALQVTIADNSWISSSTISLPVVATFVSFLERLLSGTPSASAQVGAPQPTHRAP